MERIVTSLENFDHKRKKVTLDYDEVTFLLYRGEAAKLGIEEGALLTEEAYRAILDDILIPRARKRVLYYLKNGDKTENEVRRKLEEGYYPPEVIEAALGFLREYGLADDERYLENFIGSRRGKYSRREIEAKLYGKGLKGPSVWEKLRELVDDSDEEEAAVRTLKSKYPRGLEESDTRKAYEYLSRKGFSPDTVRKALDTMGF